MFNLNLLLVCARDSCSIRELDAAKMDVGSELCATTEMANHKLAARPSGSVTVSRSFFVFKPELDTERGNCVGIIIFA